MSKLVTDMNDRERTRFSKAARKLAEAGTKLADALEAGEDEATLMALLELVIGGPAVTGELVEVFKSVRTMPDVPKEPPTE